MEHALAMIDRRMGTVEEVVSGLRERVARLETGQTYYMTTMQERTAEIAAMQDTAESMSERHQKTATDVATIRSYVDNRKEMEAGRGEARRYYRSILVPMGAALFIWATTGNLDLVKILAGIK